MGHAELATKASVRASRGGHFPDGDHGGSRELRTWGLLASRHTCRIDLPTEALFVGGITDVVGGRAEEEMSRAHAVAYVAAVADMHAGWDGAVGQLPHRPMGAHLPARDRQPAVAIAATAGGPEPTVIRHQYVPKKPLFEWFNRVGHTAIVHQPATVVGA